LSYVNDSVAFDYQIELNRLCQQLLEGKIFDRLVALANVDAKQAGALSEALSWELQKRLRTAPSKSLAEALLAVKRYRERVMANVNPRTAAQALALELEC
jgi:hypothetical protein